MKRKIIFLLILCIFLLFVLVQLNKNTPQAIIRSINLAKTKINNTETLEFAVAYLGIFPFIEATLDILPDTVYNSKKVYHITAQARALKLVSFFFNASAKMDSYIDKEKLYPLRFMQTLIIPDKPKDEKEVIYNQKNNIMELRQVRRQILPDTQDFLSVFFFIRKQPFKVGKEFDLNINTNQKNYRFYSKIIDRKEYDIRGQKIGVWILKADIRRRDKSPRHSSSIIMWILDNQSKTPILMKSITNIGSISARLISI